MSGLARPRAQARGLSRTVLHLDKDFELIAEVTGQPVERPTTDEENIRRSFTSRAARYQRAI